MYVFGGLSLKSVKLMLLGIAISLLGIACGICSVLVASDVAEVAMIFLLSVGFIVTIIGFFIKDNSDRE